VVAVVSYWKQKHSWQKTQLFSFHLV